MCLIFMNNEFKTITIIALSHVDVSKKYKMKADACNLLYTGAFVFLRTSMQFYDLWASHKYQNQLKISRRLCGTAHRCVYVSICTGAIVRPMGTT